MILADLQPNIQFGTRKDYCWRECVQLFYGRKWSVLQLFHSNNCRLIHLEFAQPQVACVRWLSHSNYWSQIPSAFVWFQAATFILPCYIDLWLQLRSIFSMSSARSQRSITVPQCYLFSKDFPSCKATSNHQSLARSAQYFQESIRIPPKKVYETTAIILSFTYVFLIFE